MSGLSIIVNSPFQASLQKSESQPHPLPMLDGKRPLDEAISAGRRARIRVRNRHEAPSLSGIISGLGQAAGQLSWISRGGNLETTFQGYPIRLAQENFIPGYPLMVFQVFQRGWLSSWKAPHYSIEIPKVEPPFGEILGNIYQSAAQTLPELPKVYHRAYRGLRRLDLPGTPFILLKPKRDNLVEYPGHEFRDNKDPMPLFIVQQKSVYHECLSSASYQNLPISGFIDKAGYTPAGDTSDGSLQTFAAALLPLGLSVEKLKG
ncbi:MAG: hypothetical protein K2X01_10025 [Cyanobacteria bacterium]|nr:hypothetical protein [Cyanobacteriota bacterium]